MQHYTMLSPGEIEVGEDLLLPLGKYKLTGWENITYINQSKSNYKAPHHTDIWAKLNMKLLTECKGRE